ncbi:MAG: CRISPR-associated endonuclease Cas1 [Methylococcaceae bacterium]
MDGPSLRVTKPETADRRFPLKQVSHIVSTPDVDWELPALLACTGRGITVNFIDDQGQLIARCIGPAYYHLGLDQLLESFFYRPESTRLYRQWLAAVENMALRSLIRRAGIRLDNAPDPKLMRQLFRREAQAMGMLEHYERVERQLMGLLMVMVTQFLSELGIDASHYNLKSINLVHDLAEILAWDFQLGRMGWYEERMLNNQKQIPGMEEVTHFFEARQGRVGRLLVGLLSRLHRWLLET